jgi:hypothetical protein
METLESIKKGNKKVIKDFYSAIIRVRVKT